MDSISSRLKFFPKRSNNNTPNPNETSSFSGLYDRRSSSQSSSNPSNTQTQTGFTSDSPPSHGVNGLTPLSPSTSYQESPATMNPSNTRYYVSSPRTTSPLPPGQSPYGAAPYPQAGIHTQYPPLPSSITAAPSVYPVAAAPPPPTIHSTVPPVDMDAQNRGRLIVGIDFGTTFSGVAYAFVKKNDVKEDIITEWPGAGTQTKQKIPSTLYYDQYQNVTGWGTDISGALAPTGYPKPGVQKVEWFKLQLMLPANTYFDSINLPPLPPGKSEVDVAADFLFKLRQAVRAKLQNTLGDVFNREEQNIRYYLTVPAIWNEAGKAATRAAAIQAGFLRSEDDNRLTLVSEPEAAAIFCSKAGLLNLKIDDALLIVDCGGGTVDLVSYQVEEENPFSVTECTAGSGDSCGSTTLNRNFSNVLRAKIRKMRLPDGSRIAGRVYAKCIMDFENRIKADFRNNGQTWAVDVGLQTDYSEAGIEDGYMMFTNEEILQCYEPVVNRVLELVRSQIITIQAQNVNLQVSPPPFPFVLHE